MGAITIYIVYNFESHNYNRRKIDRLDLITRIKCFVMHTFHVWCSNFSVFPKLQSQPSFYTLLGLYLGQVMRTIHRIISKTVQNIDLKIMRGCTVLLLIMVEKITGREGLKRNEHGNIV